MAESIDHLLVLDIGELKSKGHVLSRIIRVASVGDGSASALGSSFPKCQRGARVDVGR